MSVPDLRRQKGEGGAGVPVHLNTLWRDSPLLLQAPACRSQPTDLSGEEEMHYLRRNTTPSRRESGAVAVAATCRGTMKLWICSCEMGLCSRMTCSLMDIMLVIQFTRLGLMSVDMRRWNKAEEPSANRRGHSRISLTGMKQFLKNTKVHIINLKEIKDHLELKKYIYTFFLKKC